MPFGTAVAVLAVVMFGQVPGEGRWASELSNFAHAPAFAIVTLTVIALLRRAPVRPVSALREYSLAIAVSLLLGALVELLQLMTGRDASFDDLLRDALGALAATGFLAVTDPKVRERPSRRLLQRIGLLVGVTSTAIIIAPLAITGTAYLQRHRNFPTLVDFSSPVGTYFLGAYSAVTVQRERLPIVLAGDGEEAVGLHARLQGNKGWGLALWEPYPDWRGYDSLALDLANPTGATLLLRVRIRDHSQRNQRQAGYFGMITIPPRSRRTWTIPLERLAAARGRAYVNTTTVHSLVLTRDPGNRAQEFYLMRIWLMRD
ncbi:MAG: hypothetical protein H6Q05_5093 [Acidobacteria bacterium]|nr:hypothetical protein [Acidobacteriota bacterium]